jgi:hypothetical protein
VAHSASIDDLVDELYVKIIDEMRQVVNRIALHSVSSGMAREDLEAFSLVTRPPWPATLQNKLRARLEKQGFTVTYETNTLRVSWREPPKPMEDVVMVCQMGISSGWCQMK